jgi:mRNA interferase ChpB
VANGLAVPLSGTGMRTQGVVLCNQPRVLDLLHRGASFTEKSPQVIVDEVIAKLLTLLE